MPTLIGADNSPVEVSDAEAPTLLASGKFGLTKSSVNLVRQDGTLAGSIDSSNPELLKFLANGYRLEHPEEEHKRFIHENYDNPLLAGAAGAARTLSFGATDVLGKQLGLAPALKGLAEESPIATAVGEYGALPLSLLVPGGEGGAISKGLRALTAPIRGVEALGQTASKAARTGVESYLGLTSEAGSKSLAKALSKGTELATQGIVEGALYGTGQIVSEHALGDTELNAERVIVEIGGSALLGGVIGGTAGSLIGAASPFASKFKNRMMSRLGDLPISKDTAATKLDEWANYQSLKSTGIIGGALNKLEEKGRLESSAKAIREALHPDGKPIFSAWMKQSEIAERLDETVNSIGREIGSTRDIADNMLGKKSGYDNEYFADQIEKEIVGPASKFAETFPVRDKFQKIVDDLRSTTRKSPNIVLPNGEPLKIPQEYSIRDIFNNKKTFTDAYNSPEDVKGIKRSYKKAERIYADAMNKSVVSQLNPENAERYLDLNKLFSDLTDLNKLVQKRKNVLAGNRAFSLGDRLLANNISGVAAGVLGSELTPEDRFEGAALGYGAAMLGGRAIRTRLPSLLAVMLDKGARMMATEKAINAASKAENEAVNTFVAQGFVEKNIIGRKLRKETIKGAEGSFDAKLQNGSPVPDEGAREYAAKQAEIYTRYMNPKEHAKIAEKVRNEVEDVAPQMAIHISNKLMAIAAFLASKAPKPPPFDLLQPKSIPKWKPTNQQTVSYLRYIRAVDKPLSVLEDIQNGSVNVEGVEVLRTLYPRIYQKVMMESLKSIADTEHPIPYNKRLMLSVMFGLDHADKTSDPDFMRVLQSNIQQQTAQDAAKQQGSRIRQGGISNIGDITSKSLTTETQRIGSGGSP